MRRLLCDRSNWQRWAKSTAALNASHLLPQTIELDGEGRYQDWKNDEMLNMLGQYRSYLNACANDGAQREPETRLTAEHIKAL